jgi:Spy/CpxP family protein refolding chaperone
MRTRWTLAVAALTLLVFAVSAGSAAAQQRIPSMPRFTLLVDEQVQAELKLTDEQKQKIKEKLDSVVERGEGGRVTIRIQGGPDTITELEEETTKVLDEAQRGRLREVWLQQAGPLTFADEDIAKELKLTNEQKGKVAAALDAHQEKVMTLRAEAEQEEGGFAKMAPKFQKLREETGNQLKAMLDEAQKKRWEAMQGKKFERKKK